MSRPEQTEIQLGHRCNNRCVFCVSGQLTELGKAPPIDVADVLAELRAARAEGQRKVTFLGGEPTIQPFFLDVVRAAVELGFETIVVFSNGSVTGSSDLVDRVLATGGSFEWRFSFQGADEASHERTTRKSGSFAKLLRSVEITRARAQRVTVNMCVVTTNYESLPAFGALLEPRGVAQLHVDMFHPDDTGEHPPGELEALIPRYSDLAAPLRAMVEGFSQGFDVSVGNLPQCIAPELAPWIRHGGQSTRTITVDVEGRGALNPGWDKYAHKQQRKLKPASCASCVFDGSCTGVFPQYAEVHGLAELTPVPASLLDSLDPEGELAAVRLRAALLERLHGWDDAALALRADGQRAVTVTATEGESLVSLRVPVDGEGSARFDTLRGPRAAEWRAILEARLELTTAARPVERALRRLRASAPFGALRLDGVDAVPEGADVRLSTESGERAVFELRARGASVGGGYRLEGEPQAASDELREGLAAVLGALRAG